MTLNTVQTILGDMQAPNEKNAIPHGGLTGIRGSAFIGANMPPKGANAITARGGVYADQNNVYPPNVMVEIKNIELYYWSLAQKKWVRLQAAASPFGGMFSYNFTAHHPPVKSNPSGGGLAVVMENSYLFHFFAPSKVPIKTADVGAVYSTVAGRVILQNPSGPDNRAASRFIINQGADWYGAFTNLGTSAALGVGSSKYRYLTAQWQAYNFYTGGPATVAKLTTSPFPDRNTVASKLWTEAQMSVSPPPLDALGLP